MNIKKQVWRMNTGSRVPSDLNNDVIHRDGSCSKLSVIDPEDFALYKKEYDIDVVAYQTTRTKGAKYGRVECGECGGYGLVHGGEILMLADGESIPNFITEQDCPDCNGKGYVLTEINNA